MPRTTTTLSVHPERAARLKEVRDDNSLPNLDAALQQVLEDAGATDSLSAGA